MGKREATPTLDRPPVAAPPRVEPLAAPTRPADSLADELAQQELDFARAAETIFARPDDTWSAGDWAILRRVGPRPGGSPSHDRSRFNDWLQREQGRHATIRAQQARAGTSHDREQARQLAEQTAAKLATEAPQIEVQIAALQQQLATLARDAKLAADAVARQEAALVVLRDEERLPSWVTDELRSLSRRHTETFKRELVGLRGRLAGIAAIMALDPETQQPEIQLHVSATPALGNDTVSRVNRFFDVRTVTDKETKLQSTRVGKLIAPVWQAYVQDLLAEAAAIRPRIAELEPQEAAAKAEVEKLRSFYIPL